MTLDERQQAIQRFADDLSALRASHGNPSFRKMAQISGCISHTTLHEAASGQRFPSWDTTREFVISCGADTSEWRTRWAVSFQQVQRVAATQQSRQYQVGEGGKAPTTRLPIAKQDPVRPTNGEFDTPEDDGERVGHWWQPAWVPVAISLVAVVAFAGLFIGLDRSGTNSPVEGMSTSSVSSPSANGIQAVAGSSSSCDPPTHAAAHGAPITPLDSSSFGTDGDVTYPDCSTVKVGQTFIKRWRLQNVGSATWVGRSLWRMGGKQTATSCRSSQRAVVPRTAPGRSAVVSISVTAPASAQTCFVKFEMLDAQGRRTFPGARPVFFYVYAVA